VLGSSGEVPYLTEAERDLVLETALEAAAGRVPVLVGISEQTTVRVLAEADRLLAIGGDAAVVTTPFYALSDAAEVERHLRTVADHIDVPLFAYDVPVRTHMKMPFDVLVRLAEEGVGAAARPAPVPRPGARHRRGHARRGRPNRPATGQGRSRRLCAHLRCRAGRGMGGRRSRTGSPGAAVRDHRCRDARTRFGRCGRS